MLKILRPIFEHLSKEELLKRCLHGKTQNVNESFSNIARLKCPKTVFVNRQNNKLGVNSAILQLNDGAHAISNILEQFSIKYGIYGNISSSINEVIRVVLKSFLFFCFTKKFYKHKKKHKKHKKQTSDFHSDVLYA